LDDDVIKLRQTPILLLKEPTITPSITDPVRPVVTIYTRQLITSSWKKLSFSEIRDFNVSTGEIYLKTKLTSTDPNLIKVDYTTVRSVYHFKEYNGTRINLNPYPGGNKDLIGRTMYIYMLPSYVKDNNGRVIPESVEDKTVRFSLESNIFDPTSSEYHPLAVQLGTVFVTTALDVNELVVLDTRQRGGGVKDSANLEEVRRIVSESVGYWDIGSGEGETYPRAGFVIIRLPKELKDQIPESELRDVIDKNITVGVRYEIEDLEGGAWS
jgi:hypothetical protein